MEFAMFPTMEKNSLLEPMRFWSLPNLVIVTNIIMVTVMVILLDDIVGVDERDKDDDEVDMHWHQAQEIHPLLLHHPTRNKFNNCIFEIFIQMNKITIFDS
jgi:hypothetical protein